MLRVINRKFSDALISKITAPILNDFFGELLMEGKLKRNTVKLYKWIITTVLKYADEKGMIDSLPIVGKLNVPFVNLRNKKKLHYLERGEIKKLVKAL